MKIKSRKEARKEFRKAKKIKKHEFFSKKKPKNKQGNNFNKKYNRNEPKQKGNFFQTKEIEKISQKIEKSVNKEKCKKEFKNPQEQKRFEREKEKKEKNKLEKAIQQQRIKQLKVDNMKEDVEIRKLEKQLKMRKGKSKAFANDGLDYLLEICDKSSSENAFEKTLEDSDSEFESDFENILGESETGDNSSRNKKKKKGEVSDNDDDYDDDDFVVEEEEDEVEGGEEEEEEEEIESDFSDNERINRKSNVKKRKMEEKRKKNYKEKKVKFSIEIDKIMNGEEEEEGGGEKEKEEEEGEGEGEENDDNSETESVNEKKAKENAKMWEDIYGRTRDDKGNVVKTYTPPHLRKKAEEGEKSSEKVLRLKKQLKGLLNRLAESNMAFISNQVEQLYMQNSRNDMNETLCTLFSDSIIAEVLTPERLIAEHAMLIAILHANIGSEIGAHFLQFGVTEFCKLLEKQTDVEDKRINNILIFIMHLYNFQIFHSKLMYDLINELLSNLEEKQIELLLATFRTVGFNLRKDDPLSLKALILKVQEKANSVSTGENRVKFMLEMLMAIKNNNICKIPNYNPEFVEKLRKNLKILVRKGNYSTELNISLQDLLNAEKHGRWWIVGSAWSGTAPSQPDSKETKKETLPPTEISQKLLELAKKQRMNTDVRKNIFCILMSAEDYLEAFEKLLKLKLKGAVEREIMNVLVHCALQEKNFNPYYVFLANKFCLFDRKYQMMLQCAIWDKIKELKNALPVQVTNLAKFIGNIVLEKGLPISVLKVVQFSELDKASVKFMRQVLLTVLVSEDKNAVAAVFKRIADSPKLKLFRESLRLFLQHFVLKNTAKNAEEEKVARLAEMVKIAERVLTSSDGRMVF